MTMCVGSVSSANLAILSYRPFFGSFRRVWLLRSLCPWHGGPPSKTSMCPLNSASSFSPWDGGAPNGESKSRLMSSGFVVEVGKLLLKTFRACGSESTARTDCIRFPIARHASQTPSDIAPQPLKTSAVRTSFLVSVCAGHSVDRRKVWSANVDSVALVKLVL